LENIQGNHKHPIWPPITINMLQSLRTLLNLNDPFEACIWAMSTCAFWGMMHFGEVSVKSHNDFDNMKYIKRQDMLFGFDQDGKHYAHLDLPSAKTAKPGEIQSVFLVPQDGLCPLKSLCNLAAVVPAGPDNPLFSWHDHNRDVHPMVKIKAIHHINTILKSCGWGTTFGHSLRIGGASFYPSKKIDPKIICIAGCWRSLAYEVYICAFEQVASCHFGGLLGHS
ncbi:hypothetical protein L208DRAFT_1279344, partial [Tricholoma matsutake]